MYKKLLLNVFFVILLVSFVSSSDWYVATNGSDTAVGTDVDHPLLTLAQAWTNVSCGETIYVMGAGTNVYGGTYREATSGWDFTGKTICAAGSYITIQPYNNQVINLTVGIETFEIGTQLWGNVENVTDRCIWNTTYSTSVTDLYMWILNGTDSEQIFTVAPSDLGGRNAVLNVTYPAVMFWNNTPDRLMLAVPNCAWNPNDIPLLVSRQTQAVSVGNSTILKNFTILGGKSGIYSSTSKISKNTVIDGNTILAQRGIDFRAGAENITVKNNVIFTNRQNWSWQMVKDHTATMEKDGIFFADVVIGVNVTGNRVSGFYNGILLDSTGSGKFVGAVVENNIISDILDDAIELEDYAYSYIIKGNNIRDSFVGFSLAPTNSIQGRSNISFNLINATKEIWQYSTGTTNTGECFKTMNDNGYIDFIHNTCVGRGIYAGTNTNSQINNTWMDNLFYSPVLGANGRLIDRSGLNSSGVFYDYNNYYKTDDVSEFRYWNSDTNTTDWDSLALVMASHLGQNISWDINSGQYDPNMTDYVPASGNAVCSMGSTGSYVGAFSCTGCSNDISNTSYSDWIANSTCGSYDREYKMYRFFTSTDLNNCGNYSTVNVYDFVNGTCAGSGGGGGAATTVTGMVVDVDDMWNDLLDWGFDLSFDGRIFKIPFWFVFVIILGVLVLSGERII